MIKSICLVRLSALGDVLMCLPLARAIQAYDPSIQLTWVISNPAYQLVKHITDIEWIVIEKPERIKDYWAFRRQFNTRTFDVLLATQASARANLLYPWIRAKRKIGFDRLRAKDGHGWFISERITPGKDHTLESFLKFAQPLGIPISSIEWRLPLGADALLWANARLKKDRRYLIVNPAASKPERSWLIERYIEIIKYAQEAHQCAVILTGGPSAHDKALGEAISAEVSVENLIGLTTPPQLLALISMVNLVLCPDTGPSHMAAAVGTPVIALQAVTNAYVSGPYPFLQYAVNRYPDAVRHVLGQSLADCPWGTHVHGFEAMKLITIDDVKQRVNQVLASLDKL